MKSLQSQFRLIQMVVQALLIQQGSYLLRFELHCKYLYKAAGWLQ
ncbi:hypothetical protein QDS06_00095 [Acinetobacter baumannii]|nr:hypothetical protein [Acinetobacter baumannii]MDH2622543.1 hypothetical protein [Acinetobacter baumannii]